MIISLLPCSGGFSCSGLLSVSLSLFACLPPCGSVAGAAAASFRGWEIRVEGERGVCDLVLECKLADGCVGMRPVV